MLLNETKCQFGIIESSRCNRAEAASFKVLNETIYEKKVDNILGITIDNNINMKKHIKSICKKSGNKLNALGHIIKYPDLRKRKFFMKSFVISQFNYCPVIWMYCLRELHIVSRNLMSMLFLKKIALFPYIIEICKLYL